MAITVGGTSITFNDGTTQTTAAGGAPTTAQVLTATAGASVGGVGTYAFLVPAGNANFSPGATFAGSNCRYAKINSYWYGYNGTFLYAGGAPSGTWMALGLTATYSCCGFYNQGPTVFLRIA